MPFVVPLNLEVVQKILPIDFLSTFFLTSDIFLTFLQSADKDVSLLPGSRLNALLLIKDEVTLF